MLVITFRGAYYPVDYYYYYAAGHEGDEDKSFYGSTSSSSDDDDDDDESEVKTDGQPKTDSGTTKITEDDNGKQIVKKLGVIDTRQDFVPDDMADDDVYTFPSTLPSGSMLDEQYLQQQQMKQQEQKQEQPVSPSSVQLPEGRYSDAR